MVDVLPSGLFPVMAAAPPWQCGRGPTTPSPSNKEVPCIFESHRQRGFWQVRLREIWVSGMDRFAAMVAGRRAASAPKAADEGKKVGEEGDEKYLRIQLEEIVIVKDDAYDALAAATAAAHSRAGANGQFSGIATATATATATPTGAASTYMENCARAAAAARGAVSTRVPAAQGAWTTAARGVGFD
uniref:Uncharacterized protein n=1 Tax=Avena sativa TaxID=4498 RepID=A0ACD5XRM6_AVESA